MAYYDEGKYRVRIVAQALDAGGKKDDGSEKNPSLQLAIMPIGFYEHGELQEMNEDWERTIYLPLTEGTLGTPEQPGWVLETLKFLGFHGESFGDLDPENPEGHSFVGCEIDAICKHDTWKGKTQEKWSVHRGSTGLKAKAPSSKEVRGLDAKFQKLLKTLKDTPAKTPAPPAPPAPPTPPAPPAGKKKPRKARSTVGSEQFNEDPLPPDDEADIPF